MKRATPIFRRLQHLGNSFLLSYYFRALDFISKIFSLIRACAYFQITIPPWREARGRPVRRNVEKQGVSNAPEVQPQGEVTNVQFIEAIRMMSRATEN